MQSMFSNSTTEILRNLVKSFLGGRFKARLDWKLKRYRVITHPLLKPANREAKSTTLGASSLAAAACPSHSFKH